MKERTPGMRVGVFPVDLIDDAHAYHYGRGTYEGDFFSPIDFPLGELLEKDSGKPAPRIRLDSGVEIWGHECWWMPEADFNEALRAAEALGKKVTLVSFSRKADTHPNLN